MLSANLQGLIDEVVQLGIDKETVRVQTQVIAARDAEITDLQTKLDAASSVVFDHLESNPWLLAGGTAANSLGGIGTATATQTKPGVMSATVAIVPAAPYADKYFYQTLGVHPELVRFRQEGSFLFPTAGDAAAPQAIEFDLQQVIGGVVYNWGVQFDYGEGMFRVWDRDAKVKGDPNPWKETGVKLLRPAPGTWTQIILDVHREPGIVVYDKITIGGVVVVGSSISFPAPKIALPDMLNYGFQLDGGKVPQPVTVAQDNFRLTGWKA